MVCEQTTPIHDIIGKSRGRKVLVWCYICTNCKHHFNESQVNMSCLVMHGPETYCVMCPKCDDYNEGEYPE